VDGSGGGTGAGGSGGRKSRLVRRFHQFFSCVGLGSELTTSFDQADAPTTPPLNQTTTNTTTTTALPAQSSYDQSVPGGFLDHKFPVPACDDVASRRSKVDHPEVEMSTTPTASVLAASSDRDHSAVGGGGWGFPRVIAKPELSQPYTSDAVQPEVEMAVEEVAVNGGVGLAASSESIDADVEDYVERCRMSIKRRDQSFPDIFSRVPGCRPKMLFASHAARLRDLAPWMELSYETTSSEGEARTPGYDVSMTRYDVGEFGSVDVTCVHQPFVDEAPDLSQQQITSVQVGSYIAKRSLTATLITL